MIYNGTSFEPLDDESVLDCLLRNEQTVSYSCKLGNCQSCLLKSTDGNIEAKAQKGLKPTAIKQGYFLACQQLALRLNSAHSINQKALFSHARVIQKHRYTESICRLRLELSCDLYYHAGQFINLKNPKGLIRSYSLASLPSHDLYVELHIRRKHNGEMSNWIFDHLDEGDFIDIHGAMGNCFYTSNISNNTLILIGTGTGASPLLGIARDAIQSGHIGDIHFYHGSSDRESLYLHTDLQRMATETSQFFYHPCISQKHHSDDCSIGRCDDIALAALHDQPERTTLYLCGNPSMVRAAQRAFYLKGVPSTNIYTDPFDYKELRESPR